MGKPETMEAYLAAAGEQLRWRRPVPWYCGSWGGIWRISGMLLCRKGIARRRRSAWRWKRWEIRRLWEQSWMPSTGPGPSGGL